MQVKDKVIVITGAGQGLGQVMAIDLAREGAKIAMIDVNEEGLRATKELIDHADGQARCYTMNVTDEAAVESTFEQITNDFGHIDALVNNAGILRDGLFIKAKAGEIINKMSLEQFQSVLDVNVTGVFLCGREAAAQMIKKERKGVIINMSSVARVGNFGQTNYSASKAAVAAMTSTWSRELGRFGIRSVAIAPGMMRTAMTEAMKPDAQERLLKMTPVGRWGEASEIAQTVKFILENEYLNGRVVEIDGGISM
ncbi:SDR family oxidoreductase [Algicola sagamiensis]|uniref:SDR family oxidoreductase n=1 Tax=Algicola sagamiensis TaxID=163869 RepID=UPI0003717994|nr:SDR family oxidoreductase [Algicola sagamiensis]